MFGSVTKPFQKNELHQSPTSSCRNQWPSPGGSSSCSRHPGFSIALGSCLHHPHRSCWGPGGSSLGAAGAARLKLMGKKPAHTEPLPPSHTVLWKRGTHKAPKPGGDLPGTEGLAKTKCGHPAPPGSLGTISMACVIYYDYYHDQDNLFVLQSTFSTCQVLGTKSTNQKIIDN